MKCNLNDKIKAKLTLRGIKILDNAMYPVFIDDNGYYVFQLWELMNVFGEYMTSINDSPIEFITI
jgi:hypothetical protein